MRRDMMIVEAQKRVRKAEQELEETVRVVQQACQHNFVAECRSFGGLSIRICETCGYEEHARFWPGNLTPFPMNTDQNHGKTILNTEFIKRADFDYVMALRVR